MIQGYRELSAGEVDLINEIKAHAEEVGRLVKELQKSPLLDQRFVAIGKTELQQGFMALTRAVAQPTTF